MIRLTCRAPDRRQEIFAFQVRVVFKDFVVAGTRAQEFQNICHANPQSANAGASAALRVVNCDSAEAI